MVLEINLSSYAWLWRDVFTISVIFKKCSRPAGKGLSSVTKQNYWGVLPG